jgi:hypothetical protein
MRGQHKVIFLVVWACVNLASTAPLESPPLLNRVLTAGEITLQEVKNWKGPVLWIDALARIGLPTGAYAEGHAA